MPSRDQRRDFIEAQGKVFVTYEEERDAERARVGFMENEFTVVTETARTLHVTGDVANVAAFKSVLEDPQPQSVTPAPADRARVAGQDPR